jgi:membrane-associated PAP2 superfamily phosphatase
MFVETAVFVSLEFLLDLLSVSLEFLLDLLSVSLEILLDLLFDPEDGGDMFLCNHDWLSTDYTVSYPL